MAQTNVNPRYAKYEEVVTQFYQEGVCVPKDTGLTESQVESVKEAVEVCACCAVQVCACCALPAARV